MAFQFQETSNRIYLEDAEGKCIAELLFPSIGADTVSVDHTIVDSSLRGQGVAGELMNALVAKLGREHKKAVLVCTYAVKWFSSHPEYADLLADKTADS